MEDLLWRIKRQSQDLQIQRQEIRGIWDDDAALEINRRFLNPHEEDSAEILKSLGQQHESLSGSEKHLQIADEKARIAEDEAHRVDDAIGMVEQESNNAHARHSQHLEHLGAAGDLIPVVYQLIEQANNSCP